MSDFTDLVDLAAERLGGAVLAANDEFFAPKENLLKPAKPVWSEGEYTDAASGWTAGRPAAAATPATTGASSGSALPGSVRGVVVDTSFFNGNYPGTVLDRGLRVDGAADAEELAAGRDAAWTEILPRSALAAATREPLRRRAGDGRVTHLRFNIYPGRRRRAAAGLRRGRAATGERCARRRRGRSRGGRARRPGRRLQRHVLRPPPQPDPARAARTHMGDGWETKRRRGPGHDWAIVRLGARGTIAPGEVDTAHFKGNAPGSCSIEVCDAPDLTPECAFGWRSGLDHAAPAHAAPGRCPAPVRRGGWSGHPRTARDLSRRRDRAASALRERGGVTLSLARLNASSRSGSCGAVAGLLRVVPLGRGDALPPAVREHGPSARGSR